MQRIRANVTLCLLALALAASAQAAEDFRSLSVASSASGPSQPVALHPVSDGGVDLGRTLISGVPAQFQMPAVTAASPGNFYNGDNGFSINVPAGAGRLEVNLSTSPAVDVYLLIRFGTDVGVAAGAPVYDKASEGPNGSTTIAVDPCTPLQAGTYFIAVLLNTQGVAATGTITATIDGVPTLGACPLLSSGVPASFSLPAVTSSSLFRDDFSYRVAAPSGATQLQVSLATTTPGVQVNLYVRFGADNVLSGGAVVTSYSAMASGGNQLITITPSSSPPLATGTYFISLGLLTTGTPVSGAVTATVTGSGGGGASGPNLIQNPGAESGPADPNCVGPAIIPGWASVRGQPSVCAYAANGGPLPTDPGPPSRGTNYFAGGNDSPSTLSQVIDVSSSAFQIDTGSLPFTLSGWLGGFDGQDDNAILRANFLSAASATLGSASIGPVLSAERSGVTGLISKSASGLVPAGTRSVQVVLDMTRTSGTYNDGYADNLSLVLGVSSGGGAGCTYAINPVSQSFTASGGSGSVAVTAGSGCNWAASSNASFLSINSGASGAGNGTVNYTVAANTSTSSRTALLTIAGQTFTVSQSGQASAPSVTASVSTITFSATVGSNPPAQSFQVTSTVSYAISTDQSWLSVSPPSGGASSSGNTHTASANASTLGNGTYTGHIVITASVPPALAAETQPPVAASSISITVTLTITAGSGATPVVSAAVNSASFASQALPNGAIAQGSIFTLFGQAIGPGTLLSASQFPLQTTLGGVSIKIAKGSTSVDAIPLAVSGAQINAIMPSNAPTGQVQVTVTVNGRTSAPMGAQVASSSFGMFTANSNGMGPGIFTDPNFQIYTARRSAQPNQFVIAWGTGLGGINGADNQPPPVGNLPASLDITVGGKTVTNKTYYGRAPCCAGVDQIVFQIPADAPQGCFVPVIFRVNGVPSNSTTLPVDPNGGPCSDPSNPLGPLAATGGKVGAVELVRVNVSLGLFGALSADLGLAEFFQLPPGGDFAYNPILSMPPLGSCSVLSAGGIDFAGLASGGAGGLAGLLPSTIKPLKAGDKLTIQGPNGTKTVPLDKIDICDNTLGGQIPLLCNAQLPPYLSPGAYTVQGSGGADVGPFTVSIPISNSINWTNQQQLASVDRSEGAVFTWGGGDPSQVVLILGANADTKSMAGVAFLCLASPEAGSFTVPPSILAAFPATNSNSFGVILIGDLPSRNIPKFTASGILAGAGVYGHLFGTLATFK